MTTAAPPMAEADLPCARCRYNLRGLPNEGRCPECGLAVARTRKLAAPRRLDPDWVRSLRDGCALLEIAVVASVGAQVISSPLRAGIFPNLAWLAAETLPWVLCALAVWKLTRPTRAGVTGYARDPLRLPARLAAVAVLIGPQILGVWHDLVGGPGAGMLITTPVQLSVADVLAVATAGITALLYARLAALARLRIAGGRRQASGLAASLPLLILGTLFVFETTIVVREWEAYLRFAPLPGLGYTSHAAALFGGAPSWRVRGGGGRQLAAYDALSDVVWLGATAWLLVVLDRFRRGFARSARGGYGWRAAPDRAGPPSSLVQRLVLRTASAFALLALLAWIHSEWVLNGVTFPLPGGADGAVLSVDGEALVAWVPPGLPNGGWNWIAEDARRQDMREVERSIRVAVAARHSATGLGSQVVVFPLWVPTLGSCLVVIIATGWRWRARRTAGAKTGKPLVAAGQR